MIYIYNYIKLYIHIISIHSSIYLYINQLWLFHGVLWDAQLYRSKWSHWAQAICFSGKGDLLAAGGTGVQGSGRPRYAKWWFGLRTKPFDQTFGKHLETWSLGSAKALMFWLEDATLCYNWIKQDWICWFWHTPSYKPTFETQKNQATTTARFEFSTSPLRRTLKYLCSHCVQPTCTPTGYIRCLDLVYWVHKNLPLLCNEIACPPLAQVSMAATGALVASGSDDNSISLYASWPPSDAECFCWLRKKPGMFLNLLEGSTWSTNMHWSRRNYLNLSDYGILLWY